MSADTSAVTLNKFPHSKGATRVVVRTVCSQAVDKPVQCSKAVIAVREIYSELLSCCSYCICVSLILYMEKFWQGKIGES